MRLTKFIQPSHYVSTRTPFSLCRRSRHQKPYHTVCRRSASRQKNTNTQPSTTAAPSTPSPRQLSVTGTTTETDTTVSYIHYYTRISTNQHIRTNNKTKKHPILILIKSSLNNIQTQQLGRQNMPVQPRPHQLKCDSNCLKA